MQGIRIWCVCATVLSALLIADVGVAWGAEIDVEVTTTAGETVAGKLKVSSFKIKTEFGSATVAAEKIASIEFGDPDVLVTTGDVELRGKLSLSSLKLTTAGGKKTLKRSALASLVRLEGGRASGGADFTGSWAGSFGPLKLKQRGLTVKGTYGFKDEFEISGKVKGKTFAFTYREPSGGGSGTFELWDDGSAFTGTFKSDGQSNERFWGAYRIQPHMPKPVPGKVVEGQSESWLNLHLRVPKEYDGKKRYPAIAFFHGSNMTSRAYVDTIVSRWPKLAEDYILVGVDGEKISPASKPKARAYNFTYVNYSGPDWGHISVRRQSPALVAEALIELKEALPIEHWFVGGHSQGGFLTYPMVMYFPDLVAGAFPMSCNLLVQCEPDNYKDEKVRAAQRRIPLAPIHGENDNVVAFSSGEYCYQRLQDGGFPALHFFTNKAGHQFALLPVEEAIRWLEVMNSGDVGRLVKLAQASIAEGAWRDAVAALQRAHAADKGGTRRADIDSLAAKVDVKAKPEAEKLLAAIRANENGDWVEPFLEFRGSFAFAKAAEACMKAYAKLRAEHEKPANDLFYAARQERDAEARKAKQREIVEKYYASKWYPLVRGWLK